MLSESGAILDRSYAIRSDGKAKERQGFSDLSGKFSLLAYTTTYRRHLCCLRALSIIVESWLNLAQCRWRGTRSSEMPAKPAQELFWSFHR